LPLTEPGQALTGRPEDQGGEGWNSYVLNGNKVLISTGKNSNIIVATALHQQGEEAPGNQRLCGGKGNPRISVGKEEDKMGLRASDTVELDLEDCRVPRRTFWGKKGRVFRDLPMALSLTGAGSESPPKSSVWRKRSLDGVALCQSAVQFGRRPNCRSSRPFAG